MARITALLALVAIMLGIAGLAVTTERASAQITVPDSRFDLQCNQIVDPNDPGNPHPGVGVVRCLLTVDLPAIPPLPGGTLELTILAAYRDVDGNNHPSPGDRLLCVRVTLPDGTVLLDRCRPGVEVPPDVFPPGS